MTDDAPSVSGLKELRRRLSVFEKGPAGGLCSCSPRRESNIYLMWRMGVWSCFLSQRPKTLNAPSRVPLSIAFVQYRLRHCQYPCPISLVEV